jgi:membrane dipeptidase
MAHSGKDVPIADAHNDLLMLVQHFASDTGYFRRHWLPQLRAGHVATQVLPVYVDEVYLPELALRQTLRLIETALTVVGSSPELMLCREPGDVEQALAAGRIGIVLALEGCPAVGTDVELLRTLFRLGVRVASLTHFGRNSLADGSSEDDTRGGLTRAGVAAVELMQALGMLVDVSHLSLPGTLQVLDITRAPVLATHSSCRALRHHHRNLPDAQLAEIAATGGVIGINFFPVFISEGPPSVAGVVDHIEHAVAVAGVQHVGLGPDFTKEIAEVLYGGGHVIEGCDMAASVPGLAGPADLPVLTEALAGRGFSDSDVAAVMGGNLRRLLNESIGSASARSATTPPVAALATAVLSRAETGG